MNNTLLEKLEPEIKMVSRDPEFLKFGTSFYLFVSALLLLTFFTATFHKEQSWGFGAFLIVLLVLMLVVIFAGRNSYTAVFSVGALLPNLNSYIPLGPFSLTWVEISMVFSIFYFIRIPLYLNKIGLLSIGLYISCIFSLIGSPLGFVSAGILLRYGILLAFVNLLILQIKDKLLLKSFFCGLLIIPFTACASYAGEGYLIDIFSANFLEFSRAIYSFQYPIWFSFIIPLIVYTKLPKVFQLVVALFIAVIFILSFSRSIIIGFGFSGLFYVFFYKDKNHLKRFFLKFIIILLIGVGVYIVSEILSFFEFSNMTKNSNIARYEKMGIAFKNFENNPFFGVGFGASSDLDFEKKMSITRSFQEQISPEFGPLTVLTEIGIVGAFFLFCLIYLSIRKSYMIIRNKNIFLEYKFVVLIALAGCLSSFLNSNSLTSIIVYLFLYIPIFLHKNLINQKLSAKINFK